MKAMILAAGEGRRLRPITATRPKPMVEVGGMPLIEHHVRALARAGIRDIVVNLFWLGDMISEWLGDGAGFGVNITYSREAVLLETGGGIQAALAGLGDDPFVLVNADVLTEYPFARLRTHRLGAGLVGHLVLVPNPPGKASGDFSIRASRCSRDAADLTYSGIALLHPALFDGAPGGAFPLRDLLFPAAADGLLSAERYDGFWSDVGSPETLQALQSRTRA